MTDRGSVLFLYPVGFLIVILLGAIAVDLGNVWLQQRRLADAADAAANDAATYGIDRNILRGQGEVELDEGRVADIVRVSVAAHDLPPGTSITSIDPDALSPAGNPSVTVTVESTATFIFGRIVRSDGIAIRATGSAELTSGEP